MINCDLICVPVESRERETVTSSRSGTGVIPYTNSLTNQSSKHVKWSNFDNEYDLDSDLDLGKCLESWL